ncbi:MAG: purine-nucleoside phosphorylase [Cryomorphaceae bacterium]|jgi:purine-nucleoside phosphorylase
MNNFATTISNGAQSIRQHFEGQIQVALVLGSGLSDLAFEDFEELVSIDYRQIDGMPRATAPTHTGRLSILTNGDINIAMCHGRLHLYEGHSAQQVSTLVYVLRALGTETLIITNAAGALNPDYRPGDVMLISDHINATGQNPVLGQDQTLGILFPDMSDAYARKLQLKCQDAAKELDIDIHQGVYIGVLGPSLETSAERRLYRQWGGDAVGMSTVTEVIAANHCGMQVLGLSAITNLALGDENQQADTIEEVLENAAIAGKSMERIIGLILRS